MPAVHKPRRMKFRALDRRPGEKLPAIADPHQVKPIVESMELKKMSVEERIVSLGKLAELPGVRGLPRAESPEEYAAAYASLGIKYGRANCRQQAATLSALLEAAGIEHTIDPGNNPAHPLVVVRRLTEELRIDFGGILSISVERDGKKHSWVLDKGRAVHVTSEEGFMKTNTPMETLKAMENRPEFREGMNRFLFMKAVGQAE